MSIGQVIDFIMLNRTNKVFKGLTKEQVAQEVLDAITDKSIYVMVKENSISGVILAKKDNENKILFVTRNLSMSLSNLREFAKRCKEEFEGWTIQAMRHDKHRKFNMSKLYQKLT